MLSRPTDRRARAICQTFAQEAADPADRGLAAIGLTIASGDISSVTDALARLPPGALGDPLLLEVHRWLSLRRVPAR